MRNNFRFAVIIVVCLSLYFCVQEHTISKNDTVNCFGDNFSFANNVFGDVMIKSTKRGNFVKYRCLNNGQIVTSFGRALKEKVIDTSEFTSGFFNRYNLLVETEDMMVLRSSGGTNSWCDFIYSFFEDTVYCSTSLYIDTTQMTFVSLYASINSDSVAFIINRMHYNSADTFLINYYNKPHKQGYVPFFITNVRINGDELFYEVDESDSTKRIDSISILP